MKETIHILATVRRAELLPAALLVFRTLRVGFPSAPVQVWGNGLTGEARGAVENATAMVGGTFTNLAGTVHDTWIESLVLESFTPFWIVDTDVVFWGNMDKASGEAALAGGHQVPGTAAIMGRFEPAFQVEDLVHVERLHTCVMRIDPGGLRAALRTWAAQWPAPWNGTAQYPFVRQHFVPVCGEPTRFYDSMAGAYHAVGGRAFTEEEDSQFAHIHCATWSDLLPKRYGLSNLAETHKAIYEQPELARGLREAQRKYYEAHTITTEPRR